MKYKEYFSKLGELGKIDNEDYKKFLETVPDGEMPDVVFPMIDSKFLTIERAVSHKDVIKHIKGGVLDVVDKDIKVIMKYLPADKVLDIEREDNTFTKLAMIRDALPEAFQKAAKAPNDEEAKKKLHEAQENMHALTEKFNKLNESHKQEVEKVKESGAAEIKSYKLDSELEKKANSYTFADVFKDARSKLTKAILAEIKAKNKLDLIEKDGEYHIPVLDETGAPRFLNDGNTPVTINSLLDTELKPYLKVNNTDSDDGQQQQRNTKSFRVEDGKNSGSSRRGANVNVEV